MGDWVYLGDYNLIGKFFGSSKKHEIVSKIIWPFSSVGMCWKIAYKLDLPTTSSLYPIFHVSLYKISWAKGSLL